MPWTTPTTFVPTTVLTAAQMNTNVKDNTNFLHDPPMCNVFRTGDIGFTSGSNNPVNFTSEMFDTDSMHDLVTNPERITVNTAGVYLVWCAIGWAALNAVGQRTCTLNYNGSTALAVGVITNPDGVRTDHHSLVATQIAAVNDYFEVIVNQTSGVTLSVNGSQPGSASFGAQWMGSGA